MSMISNMNSPNDLSYEESNYDCIKKKELIADAEGVWSPDIEQSFQEALAIYPPCGRRKIILSEEGKMYGRNELIARYIKLRTGKTRTRKQVSSHIQVLARKKTRDLHAYLKDHVKVKKEADSTKYEATSPIPGNETKQYNLSNILYPFGTACQPSSGLNIWNPPSLQFNIAGSNEAYSKLLQESVSSFLSKSKPLSSPHSPTTSISCVYNKTNAANLPACSLQNESINSLPNLSLPLIARAPPYLNTQGVTSSRLSLLEFSVYLEQPKFSPFICSQIEEKPMKLERHVFAEIKSRNEGSESVFEAIDIKQVNDKYPGLSELYAKGPKDAFYLIKFWGDANVNIREDASIFYGVNNILESRENITIVISTKVCSFGKSAVEKFETEYPRFEAGRFLYRIFRSPLCEYVINFIRKLIILPEKYMMNSVLENFTLLQVIKKRDTNELLLCIAYAFEVSLNDEGVQHHVFRLKRADAVCDDEEDCDSGVEPHNDVE